MKISIRNAVFETNSSSTHSFTIMTSEELKQKQEKNLQIEKEFDELDKKENLTKEEQHKILNYMMGFEDDQFGVSFQIKSPLAKIVWLKGLIDHAESRKKNAKESVCEFYDDLKKEYCNLENITEDALNYRISLEESKNNSICKGGKCDQYFCESSIDKCSCGFENFISIYLNLSDAKGELSFKEFANEFLTDKYIVVGQEDMGFKVIESNKIY